MTQLEIHKKIDAFLKAGPANASLEVAQGLISTSEDSKLYFFTQADATWLTWFLENGLFSVLKLKAKDTTKYSYSLPELSYLTRVAEKNPKLVVDVILSTPISKDNFNPEVVDRFFWITGQLSVDQIKRVLPKIVADGWVKLMAPFNRSGYEYRRMIEKLKDSEDYSTLLDLTKIILTVRSSEEFSGSKRFSISEKLFYLQDISDTEVFELLTDKANPLKEESLKIVLGTLIEIVNLGKKREITVFDKTDPFYLLDVNIFDLHVDKDNRSYSREDIQNLVASCKELIELTIGASCANEAEARRIYDTYIKPLPDSLTCWRLRMYAITRCPELFKAEIKDALFRVFAVGDRYFEIDGGAEYHETLISAFRVLDSDVQREYVANVIKYYGAVLGDKDREEWRKRDGREILSYIKEHLTAEEILSSEAIFGKISDKIEKPQPMVGQVKSGFVSHKTPFNPSDFGIKDLITHLKTDASPRALSEKYKSDDFLNPRGPEGLGEALKSDFKNRKGEYLSNLNGFFDRDAVDASYVYDILRQIEDMLRADESFNDTEYLQILNFFELIRLSGEAKAFEKGDGKSFIADWITVHKVISDVLLLILAQVKESQFFKDNRSKIFSIIKYQLSIKHSPDAEDDKRESAEPAHVAINSVRGQAFRAFVQFVYNDGKKNLSGDVKALYEQILDTDFSNAVRFTIGQFFASFYFRDTLFIKGLLPKIFPRLGTGKDKLYFATWEGYLASALYKELFTELSDYYTYAINVSPEGYPERKYLKGLDETLAGHLALAYAHFDLKIGDPMFDLFWKTPNETRHYEFVSFIGRTFITRSGAGDEWFKENNVSKSKIIEFWNWIISTEIPIEPKTFSGFGFWINPDKEVISEEVILKNLPTTLQKSEGEIDWDYGMMHQLKRFAEKDPVTTLSIIKNFLLFKNQLSTHLRTPIFSIDGEIKDALTVIYEREALKKDVENLIDLLIEKGSSTFWSLKDVLK